MKKEHKKNALILMWICAVSTGLFFLTGCGFGCGNSCLGFTLSCAKKFSDGSKANYLDVSLFGHTSDFFSLKGEGISMMGCDTCAGSNCNHYAGCYASKEIMTDVYYYGCGSCACTRGKIFGLSAPCSSDGELYNHLGELVKISLEKEGY